MRSVSVLARQLSLGVTSVVLASSLILTGCSGNASSSTKDDSSTGSAVSTTMAAAQAIDDSALVNPGTLTVGLQTGTVGAPFVIVGTSERVEGIDIDLASALAADLGLQVQFVDVGSVDAGLTDRKCDVVMDVTPKHAGSSTIVGDYYESASAFFHRGDQTVVTPSELSGKKVGLQSGSVSESALNNRVLDMQHVPYANLNAAFEALEKGEVDYVLCDVYPGAYLASAYADIACAGVLTEPSAVGIAAQSDNEAVQAAITKSLGTLVANGTYDIVRGRWLGGLPAVTADLVIPNIAMREGATGENGAGDSIENNNQNGSTAGANAVQLPTDDTTYYGE